MGIRKRPAIFARSYPAHMHINIKPGYQHCGIGTRLFAALTEHLREIGCKGVMLVVDSYNTNAINFYKKNKLLKKLSYVWLAQNAFLPFLSVCATIGT